MENKIRKILTDLGFVEWKDPKRGFETPFRIFEIKNGILTVSVLKPSGNESINEEIRQTREFLWKNLDVKVLTLCTIDDTGGILMFGKEKIGEINRQDGVMELNLAKLNN